MQTEHSIEASKFKVKCLRIIDMVNESGKEIVIRAAFLVAAADGEFHDDEKALLAEIGQALDMSDAHLKGVISSVIQE